VGAVVLGLKDERITAHDIHVEEDRISGSGISLFLV
jgi:hypothetical protein